jgi:hypothetical protein
MAEKVCLGGDYRVVDHVYLYARAKGKHDPRWAFHDALLSCRTDEQYLDAVADRAMTVSTDGSSPISGRMEILYARRNGRIEDA